MEINFLELFNSNMVLMIFAVVSLGLLVGRLKIGPIQLGSTTGVLLIGLLFGHLGFTADPMLGAFGFTVFIFTVGLQAGPTFFSVFFTEGAKYITLAVVVAGSALGTALLIAALIGLDYGMNAGLLAGSLTSTPTLAGAQDAINSGIATPPEGMAATKASQNVSVAYAITYIFGTIGLIVFIRYLPILLRIDLPEEARKLARERGFGQKKQLADSADRIPLIRAYRIPDGMVGKTIAELRAGRSKKGLPLRIRRAGAIVDASLDQKLKKGDIVSVIGSLYDHEHRGEEIGEEVLDPELLNYDITTKEIVIISNDAAGKSLSDIGITEDFGCYVRSLKRASIELTTDGNVIVNKGDRLYVTGEARRLDELADKIGSVEAEETQTDLFNFSIGIFCGVLIGMVMLRFGGISVGIGSAGGLLLIGILFGFLRSVYPAFGGVPAAARSILMEFGLVLFMAGVGLKAGGGILEGFVSAGPQLLLGGVVVTLLPVIIGYGFGRKILKMNAAILLGSITGAMTSTPSLNVVTGAAKSEIPALGYAGTYTFANVLLTFAGAIMMNI